MPFLALLPLIIVGVIISITSRAAAVRKQEEARKRATAFDERQSNPQMPPVRPQAPQPPKPTVQPPQYTQYVPPVRLQTQQPTQPRTTQPNTHAAAMKPSTVSSRVSGYEGKPTQAKMHTDHDLCALESEDSVQAAAVPARQSVGTTLALTPDNIVRGVVFAEIFGKPKALR